MKFILFIIYLWFFLSLTGLDAPLSIKALSVDLLVDVEKEASLIPALLTKSIQNAGLKVKKNDIVEIYRLIFGNNFIDAQNADFIFLFSVGERATISEGVKFVIESFKANDGIEQSPTIPTPIGPLFCDNNIIPNVPIVADKIIPKRIKSNQPKVPKTSAKKSIQKKNTTYNMLKRALHQSLIVKAKLYWTDFVKQYPLEMDYMKKFNWIGLNDIAELPT